MEKLTWFYLDTCPYCSNAKKAYEELIAEHPGFGEVEVERINEAMHPELTEGYAYQYVPCVFLGNTKLYEAYPGEPFDSCKEGMEKALREAMKQK